MHYSHHVEGKGSLGTSVFTDNDHRHGCNPLQVEIVSVTCPRLYVIKRKVTVQRHYMRHCELSSEGEEIHICAGRKVGMYDVKIMIFNIFHRFMKVVIGLEMPLPRDTGINECVWEKRNKFCRCSGIARREQRHVVSLCHLLLYEIVQHNLRSSVVLWGNSNPRRGYVRDFHGDPLRVSRYHFVREPLYTFSPGFLPLKHSFLSFWSDELDGGTLAAASWKQCRLLGAIPEHIDEYPI